jgi:hypothetical protein
MSAKPVLVLSLLANLALAGGLVWAVKSKPTPPAATVEVVPAKTVVNQDNFGAVTNTPEPVAAASTTNIFQKFDWRAVESEDYRKYIANLRSIGCPEDTIRDIIVADVNKLYESKRQLLAGPKKKFEFWKPGGMMMGLNPDPELAEKQRALQKEKRALLVELLGSSYEEKPEMMSALTSQLEQMFDFLPTEKRSKVFDAMQDMQTKMQKAMKGGTPDPDDIRKAMKESEAAIAAILTPEEMLDYNLHMSMTANMMRMQSAGYEPTEQEFLDVFKLRKAYDDDYGGMFGTGSMSKAEKEKAEAAKKVLNEEIKKTLGDTRYAEYERAQDYNYQTLYRIGDKNSVAHEDINKLYDIKKVAEEQAKTIRNDQSLTPEARTAALQGIRSETETIWHKTLGDKAFEAYQNQNGSYWLKSISPDPKAAK